MTTEQLAYAREWCADVWADYDTSATDAQVERAIVRAYDGGVAGFVADCS